MSSAVVTGAGSGMGRACARRFCAEGWAVAGLDVDGAALKVLEQELGSERFLPLTADIREAAPVQAAVDEATARFGAAACCVNAAGIFPPTTLETANQQRFRAIFDTNVLGTVLVTQAVAPGMRRAGGGAIVNFASIDAFFASPGQLLYCASKAAVVSLTRSMALELAPSNIRVNGVAPGWVDTEGNRANGRLQGAADTIPLGRIAEPEEIADLVWLLSGEGRATYVTGETVVIGGGVLLR